MAAENAKLFGNKSKLESTCREIKKNLDQIAEGNSQIISDAKKNRDEINENFVKNVDQLKLNEGEEEKIKFTEENEQFLYYYFFV